MFLNDLSKVKSYICVPIIYTQYLGSVSSSKKAFLVNYPKISDLMLQVGLSKNAKSLTQNITKYLYIPLTE